MQINKRNQYSNNQQKDFNDGFIDKKSFVKKDEWNEKTKYYLKKYDTYKKEYSKKDSNKIP